MSALRQGRVDMVECSKSAHCHYSAFPALTACYRIEHTWKDINLAYNAAQFLFGNISFLSFL